MVADLGPNARMYDATGIREVLLRHYDGVSCHQARAAGKFHADVFALPCYDGSHHRQLLAENHLVHVRMVDQSILLTAKSDIHTGRRRATSTVRLP